MSNDDGIRRRTLSFPDRDLYERAEAKARAQGRSFSNYVVQLIRRDIQSEKTTYDAPDGSGLVLAEGLIVTTAGPSSSQPAGTPGKGGDASTAPIGKARGPKPPSRQQSI